MDLTLIPVEYILKAARVVKRLAYLIAAVAASASYGTQVELLRKHEMETWAAYAIPLTIDLLAICAAIALQVPGFPEKDRKIVQRVLTIAVFVSVTANIMGGHNMITRLGHGWPVLAYLLAEWIAGRMRTYAASVQSAKLAADAPLPVEESSTPVHATASVRKAPAQAIGSKPGSAKSKILELAAALPPLSPEEIAAQAGVKPGWVKHVVKTAKQD